MDKKFKVFIDGSQGTTGLRIHERLASYEDIELLKLPEDLRKDPKARKDMINASDISFVCLPDEAAREALSFLENPNTRMIDTSTAHRVCPDFAYGLPELSSAHRDKIASSQKCAVPGCFATGFIVLVYPLIEQGIISAESALSCFAVSGYSGGGKSMIADYESETREEDFDSPRFYSLTQHHKHIREMQKISNLEKTPIFNPIVSDYFSGMVVTVPIFTETFEKKIHPSQLRLMYEKKYGGSNLIDVLAFGSETGYFASNALKGSDRLEILISGDDERITLTARFDNLGKGASGAAIQCMNIMMGIEETKGLII
jgi:N-acetyl-gamma-glutamyl-phosphate reductase